MQAGLKTLETLLDPYDWFVEVALEGQRYVVYVSYMTDEQSVVPDMIDGHQVVMAFASSRPIEEEENCIDCDGRGIYFAHYGMDQYNFDAVDCDSCGGTGKRKPFRD